MFWSEETCNKIDNTDLMKFFTHEKTFINWNAGYDDETVEEETTTFLSLQFENIPSVYTYHKICNLVEHVLGIL